MNIDFSNILKDYIVGSSELSVWHTSQQDRWLKMLALL